MLLTAIHQGLDKHGVVTGRPHTSCAAFKKVLVMKQHCLQVSTPIYMVWS